MMQNNNNHTHNGLDSPKINPKDLLPLPVFSTVPPIAKAPNQFITINGATKRLYVKHGTTLSYVALT
jgi:hypothetical protein